MIIACLIANLRSSVFASVLSVCVVAAVRDWQLHRWLAHRRVGAVDRTDPGGADRLFCAPCAGVVLFHVAARARWWWHGHHGPCSGRSRTVVTNVPASLPRLSRYAYSLTRLLIPATTAVTMTKVIWQRRNRCRKSTRLLVCIRQVAA